MRTEAMSVSRESSHDGLSSTVSDGRKSKSVSPRKRRLPAAYLNEDEAPPPNKRIHTPTEEEKETIFREKQRLLEEKNPLAVYTCMFPLLPLGGAQGLSPVSPMYSFLQQQQQQLQPTSLSHGSSPVQARETHLGSSSSTAALNISGLPTPGGSSVGSVTPPRSTQILPNFLKYPFSPPTPSNLSLVSPWSNRSAVSDTNKATSQNSPKSKETEESTASPKKQTTYPALSAPSVLSALGSFPNQTCFLPGQSPLNYFQHPSPVSPMMYLNSPYPQSVSSIPSVSSSSGCSSSSDGAPGSVGSLNHSYAPTEYHVGPRRPLVEKIAEELDAHNESPSNSGRNTPIDVGMEDNTGIPMDGTLLAQRLIESSSLDKATTTPSQKREQPLGGETHHLTDPYQGVLNPQSYASHLTDRPSSGVSSMSSSVSSRDSTPEPEDVKHHSHPSGLGPDLFCAVPGRLSLLSSTQKYPVAVDEVRRRLSHPECLNASVLGGILRRAKSKNGGHVLRQRLESIGVSLPPGRRKATDLSLFTSLVEGEALHLAKDYHRLCENYFPCVELAQIIASQHTGTPEAQHRISMVKATQLILNELQAMVNAVGGPSNISPSDPTNPYPGLVNFSLITHGFGNPAMNACLSSVQTYLKDLLNYYEGTKPVQPDPRYRYPDNKHPQTLASTSKQYSPGPMSTNTKLDSARDIHTQVDGRNRSGLFVCLKQEPSE